MLPWFYRPGYVRKLWVQRAEGIGASGSVSVGFFAEPFLVEEVARGLTPVPEGRADRLAGLDAASTDTICTRDLKQVTSIR